MGNDPHETNAGPTGTEKCDWCGETYKPTQRVQRFCSRKCGTAYRKNKYHETKVLSGPLDPKACAVCGDEFTPKQPNHKYCSVRCRQVPPDKYYTRKKQPPRQCVVCGTRFTPKQNRHKKCSDECRAIAARDYSNTSKKTPKGMSNDIETPDPSGNRDVALGKAANSWLTSGFSNGVKEEVLAREGWQCYICGATGGLHVHHIVPRSQGGTHDPSNLVALCAPCHKTIETGDMEHAIAKCVARAITNINAIVR